jgi:hypothetical protein
MCMYVLCVRRIESLCACAKGGEAHAHRSINSCNHHHHDNQSINQPTNLNNQPSRPTYALDFLLLHCHDLFKREVGGWVGGCISLLVEYAACALAHHLFALFKQQSITSNHQSIANQQGLEFISLSIAPLYDIGPDPRDSRLLRTAFKCVVDIYEHLLCCVRMHVYRSACACVHGRMHACVHPCVEGSFLPMPGSDKTHRERHHTHIAAPPPPPQQKQLTHIATTRQTQTNHPTPQINRRQAVVHLARVPGVLRLQRLGQAQGPLQGPYNFCALLCVCLCVVAVRGTYKRGK